MEVKWRLWRCGHFTEALALPTGRCPGFDQLSETAITRHPPSLLPHSIYYRRHSTGWQSEAEANPEQWHKGPGRAPSLSSLLDDGRAKKALPAHPPKSSFTGPPASWPKIPPLEIFWVARISFSK